MNEMLIPGSQEDFYLQYQTSPLEEDVQYFENNHYFGQGEYIIPADWLKVQEPKQVSPEEVKVF